MRRNLIRLCMAAVLLVLAAVPASSGSLSDECTLGSAQNPGSMAFSDPVGRAAPTVTPPGPTNTDPTPSASAEPPYVVGTPNPQVSFSPPSFDPGDPQVDPPHEPVIVDHDEDGVPDDVVVGGGVSGDPQFGPGHGPELTGVETGGGTVSVDPDTGVDIGGVSSGERGGSYKLELPITCTSDFGPSTGTLSVGKTYFDGGTGDASGSIACDGGEASGLMVINFNAGVMAGHVFSGTWHTKFVQNRFVLDAGLLAEGHLEDRPDDPETEIDESAYPHFVQDRVQTGGFAGSLFRPGFTTDPDGDGPEQSPSTKCTAGTLAAMAVNGYMMPVQFAVFIPS